MQPVISIVGKSDSGKTTLLEGLIGGLRQRGYRVAVVKHAGEDFELDTVHKDSWRFRQAGSRVSILSSAHRLAVIRETEGDLGPRELSQFTGADCDLILTEGFKKSGFPKIEVHRREQGGGLLSPPGQLLGVVTDEPLDVDVPQFSRDEVAKIVDLIEKTALGQTGEYDVDLFVDDAYIPLSKSTKDLLFRTLLAMVSGLKEFRAKKALRISLRRKA